MDIDYNKLKTFTIVARCGQISAAARELSRTQPAITHQIQVLEDQLGFRLLERRKGLVTLTPEGRELHQYARQLFANFDSKVLSFQSAMQQPEGLLRVMALADQGNDFPVSQCVSGFCRRFPKVQIRLSHGTNAEIEAALMQDRADIGLSVIFRNPDGFVRVPVSADKHNLFASKKYLQRMTKRGRLNSANILTLDVIDLDGSLIAFAPWYRKNFPGKTARIARMKPSLTLPDFGAIRDVLAEGYGIGILPEYLVRTMSTPKLIKVFGRAKPTTSGLDVAVRSHKTLRAAEREFVRFCKNHCAN